MEQTPKNQSEISANKAANLGAESTSPGRRAFVLTTAGAIGAGLVWLLRRASLGMVEASSEKKEPSGPVTIVQFSPDGKKTGKVTVPRTVKTEDEWKQQLSPISFEVTRHAGTERAFTGDTWDNHEKGIFRCICCDTALFSSDTKFESGTGWPSFWEPIAKENVKETRDSSFGFIRTAVSCADCDAHLGHVFDDGPRPTGLRYCMNSAAMKFVKRA